MNRSIVFTFILLLSALVTSAVAGCAPAQPPTPFALPVIGAPTATATSIPTEISTPSSTIISAATPTLISTATPTALATIANSNHEFPVEHQYAGEFMGMHGNVTLAMSDNFIHNLVVAKCQMIDSSCNV